MLKYHETVNAIKSFANCDTYTNCDNCRLSEWGYDIFRAYPNIYDICHAQDLTFMTFKAH